MRTINNIVPVFAILLIACDQGSINDAPRERDQAITAAFKFPAVDSLARSYSAGLRLLTIHSSNVNFDGTSAIWSYEYLGTNPSIYCFHSTFHAVVFDSISPLRVGVTFISHSWFNTDVALAIAEANGGSDFDLAIPAFRLRPF